MKTIQYLDAVRKRLGLTSDYALQKPLGVTKPAISRYRNGHGTFDHLVAERVADILGLEPRVVVADMEIERATKPAQRKLWERIRDAAVVATMAIGAACFGLAPQPVHARGAFDTSRCCATSPVGGGASHARGECTLRSIRRRSIGDALLRFLAWLTAAVAL